MTRRGLLWLGGAAAGAIGVALLLPRPGGRRQALAAGGLAFPDLASRLQEAARIEIRKAGAALALTRNGEAWVLPEKADYPVRPETLRELLTGLTELRLIEPRTTDPALFDRLGVADPSQPGSTAVLLRVLDGAGAPLAELVLGRRRVRTQGNVPESIFVRRPGEDQAWLAEGRLSAEPDPQLWIDRDIANLPGSRIARVAVTRQGEPELVLERAGDTLRVTLPAEAPPSDDVALDEVRRAFEFLSFLDVRAATAIPGEALGAARFSLTEGLEITAAPYRDGEALWLTLAAAGGPEAAALNARWRGWAYQVGAWKEKAMVPRLADLAARAATAPSSPRDTPVGAEPPK